MLTQPDPSSTRILFIGNSYTSRNNLPRLVVDLAAAAEQPRPVRVDAIVAGGASLKRHWNAGLVHKALASAPWDYVVLQEQSTLPLKSPQRYHESVRLFDAEINRHGAKTVLYLTWTRQHAPERQDDITRTVEAIADEVKALVVPAGRAWQVALKGDPDLQLYVEDGSHPSAAGSYLAACVFHVSLFDEPPLGWSVAASLKLDRATTEKLQAAAWECRAAKNAVSWHEGQPRAASS